MTEHQMTAHFDDAAVQASLAEVAAFDLANAEKAVVIEKIITIYKAVRPFLDWASGFFLFGKKVKGAIKVFLEFMDSVAGV